MVLILAKAIGVVIIMAIVCIVALVAARPGSDQDR